MKKNYSSAIITLLMLPVLFLACNKIGEDKTNGGNETLPVVSISSDKSFNTDYSAELVLTLSEAASQDVIVRLDNSEPQEGKDKVSAIFEKSVRIPSGSTSVKVDVTADIYGLADGDYQAAISIESADGAIVSETSVTYINLEYSFRPSVTLYSDSYFTADCTAKIRLVLSSEVSEDVFVTLAEGEGSIANVDYENYVTIPAGTKETELTVTVDVPENLAPGVYPAIIEIVEITNAVKGDATSVTINLSYPFSTNIQIDGSFDDWNTSSVLTWTLPEGDVLYKSMKVLKLAANEKRVFLYIEFEDPGFDFNMPFNIYIDADGNPQTGAIVGNVDNDTAYPPYPADKMGLSHYLEIALHDVDKYNDFYTYGGLYRYDGKDGDVVFSNLTNISGSYTSDAIYGSGVLEDGIGRIEVQFSREFFGMKGEKARFAVKNMDGLHNWAAYGLLPQGVVVDGVRQLVDMAEVVLPEYVE